MKKFVVIFGILGIGILVYFLVIGPHLNRSEGDPYFVFVEIPANATTNNSIIHLENKDILNVRGLDVTFENGKLAYIFFRYSDTIPAISYHDFNDMYGSRLDDPSTRKYLEYKGVFYYATLRNP